MANQWIGCPACGHKLFRLDNFQPDNKAVINIKCNSCGGIINVVVVDGLHFEIRLEDKKHD